MDKNRQTEFLACYEPVHEPLLRFCRTIAPNLQDAEDLVNDTVLNALQNFEKIRDRASFKAYIFTIASNLSKKKFRRMIFRGDIDEADLNEIVDITQNPEYVAEYRLIYEKIMNLPQKVSEAIILFHIVDLTLL
ncbi:MAG: RNA polymerase sigma factor [Bacteroidota bacterium]